MIGVREWRPVGQPAGGQSRLDRITVPVGTLGTARGHRSPGDRPSGFVEKEQIARIPWGGADLRFWLVRLLNKPLALGEGAVGRVGRGERLLNPRGIQMGCRCGVPDRAGRGRTLELCSIDVPKR